MKKLIIAFLILASTITLTSCVPSQKVSCGGPALPVGAKYNAGATGGTYKKGLNTSTSLNSYNPLGGSCSFICDVGKTWDGSSCLDSVAPVACSIGDAAANSWNISNATAVAGLKIGVNVSQCHITMCADHYSLSTSSCQAITSACTATDATENGWDTSLSSGVIGNRVGSVVSDCAVSVCTGGYALNADDKSCGVTPAICDSMGVSSTGPGGYRYVSRLAGYNNKDTCVAKYEAQKDPLTPFMKAVSYKSGLMPWTKISRPDAKSACALNGMGFHLIKNNEWQATARGMTSNPMNWSTSVTGDNTAVGTGAMTSGHSNYSTGVLTGLNHNKILPSAFNATGEFSATLAGSKCAWSANTSLSTNKCSDAGAQVRVTLTPPSAVVGSTAYPFGQSIWDFAGNVEEWVDSDENLGSFIEALTSTVPVGIATGVEAVQLNPSSALGVAYGPSSSCTNNTTSPFCGYGALMYFGTNATGPIVRGGDYNTSDSGVFTSFRGLNLDVNGIPEESPGVQSDRIGFRCVYSR
jgi:hypothetical protein